MICPECEASMESLDFDDLKCPKCGYTENKEDLEEEVDE